MMTCPSHTAVVHRMVADMDRARADVDLHLREQYARDHAFMAVLIAGFTLPACCPAAGFAKYLMAAAFRERFQGEPETTCPGCGGPHDPAPCREGGWSCACCDSIEAAQQSAT